MKIINSSEINLLTKEPLSRRETYKMCNSQSTGRMKDIVGTLVTVSAFVVYEDIDKKTEEPQNILVMLDDTGAAYGTNSPTFQSYFLDLWEYFKEDPDGLPAILICEGTTKNGRTFVYPDIE